MAPQGPLAKAKRFALEMIETFTGACFSSGTPVHTEFGNRPIETIRPGERLWSRDEDDPTGPMMLQEVEETFVREALIWELKLGGQIVRTTAEHPFWREGDGWVPINLLAEGDRLLCEDGSWVVLESIADTGEWDTVYNMRVANTHTYYVGCAEWGFNVWVHNLCYQDWLAKHGLKDTQELKALWDGAAGNNLNRTLADKVLKCDILKGGGTPGARARDAALKELDRVEAHAARKMAPRESFAAHEWGNSKTVPCFPADTVVHTPVGMKPIQSIQEGDEVLAYDERGCEIIARKVTICLRNWTQHLVRIDVAGETIYATRNHPFYHASRRLWVEASELTPGDIVMNVENRRLEITDVAIVAAEEDTYNFEVEESHTYFVGEAGILVHNEDFSKWESTTKTYTEIYVVRDLSGKVVYIGQTVNGVDQRFKEHLGDGHPHWKDGYTKKRIFADKWTPYEASVWEQHYIDTHGGKNALENKINAIAEKAYLDYKNLHKPC